MFESIAAAETSLTGEQIAAFEAIAKDCNFYVLSQRVANAYTYFEEGACLSGAVSGWMSLQENNKVFAERKMLQGIKVFAGLGGVSCVVTDGNWDNVVDLGKDAAADGKLEFVSQTGTTMDQKRFNVAHITLKPKKEGILRKSFEDLPVDVLRGRHGKSTFVVVTFGQGTIETGGPTVFLRVNNTADVINALNALPA